MLCGGEDTLTFYKFINFVYFTICSILLIRLRYEKNGGPLVCLMISIDPQLIIVSLVFKNVSVTCLSAVMKYLQ